MKSKIVLLRKVYRFTHPFIYLLALFMILLKLSSPAFVKQSEDKAVPTQWERRRPSLSLPIDCPKGMAPIPANVIRTDFNYRIDGRAIIQNGTNKLVPPFCMDIYEYPNQRHVRPRVKVSKNEAAKLCLAQGKRLCTEHEWMLACAGPELNKYSYGSDFEPWRCNTNGANPGDDFEVAPSGSHPGCRNYYGIYDLNGNVSEWVETDDKDKKTAYIRGGTVWVAEYGQDCFSRHTHSADDATWVDDGFRCCSNPIEYD